MTQQWAAADTTEEAGAAKEVKKKKKIGDGPTTEEVIQAVATWLLNSLCLAAVFLATGGIMYALVASVCLGTKTCDLNTPVLVAAGARCKTEVEDNRLLHLQSCPVICKGKNIPSVDEIQCVDGVLVGLEGFTCTEPPAEAWFMEAPDLGEDFNIDQAADSVCKEEARCGDLEDASVFVAMRGLSEKQCRRLLHVCRKTSLAYSFAEHDGTLCRLGCYNKDRIVKRPPELETPEAAIVAESIAKDKMIELREGTCFFGGPRCINIQGSCNAADDGDYYRLDTCKNEFALWEQLNGSRQMHRVSSLQRCGQGGYWVLQRPGDPYGELDCRVLGRQDSFGEYPMLGMSGWAMQCTREVAEMTFKDFPDVVDLTLSLCACSDADCNGHGTASGTKLGEDGPDGCKCECEEEWFGRNCEFRKCRDPPIPNTLNPSCREGKLIKEGQKCTVRCKIGFWPSTEFITCQHSGLFEPRANFFRCEQDMTGVNTGMTGDNGTTPSKLSVEGPEVMFRDLRCYDSECGPGGKPDGQRDPNTGNCICVCKKGWDGPRCSKTADQPCRAPLMVEKSLSPACKEGESISSQSKCTPQCEQGYIPTTKRLDCFRRVLTPPKYECVKARGMQETLCQGLQALAIAVMCVAALFILWHLSRRFISSGRPIGKIACREHNVDVGKDDFGSMHVVKCKEGNTRPERFPGPKGAHANVRRMEMQDSESGTPMPPDCQPPMLPRSVWDNASPRLSTVAIEDEWDSSEAEESEEDLEEASEVKMLEDPRDTTLKLTAGAPMEPHQNFLRSAEQVDDYVSRFRMGASADYVPRDTIIQVWGTHNLLAISDSEGTDPVEAREGPMSQTRPSIMEDASRLSISDGRLSIMDSQGSKDSSQQPRESRKTLARRSTMLLEMEQKKMELYQTSLEQGQQLELYKEQMEARGAVVRAEALLARRKAGAVVFAEQLEHLARDLRQLSERGANAGDRIIDELEQEACKIIEEEKEEDERRAEVEDVLTAAMRGSVYAELKDAAENVRSYLAKSQKCPSAKRVRLERYLQLADDRIKRANERDAKLRREESLRQNVKKGIMPNYDMTPKDFWVAVENSDLCSVEAGLKARLPPLGRCKSSGLTMIHVACQRAESQAGVPSAEGLKIVRLLLEARADGNVRDPLGRTPLDLVDAVEGRSEEVVQRLAALGLVRSDALPPLRTMSSEGASMRFCAMARPHTAP